MSNLISFLGANPTMGGLVCTVAGVAFIAWEYRRLTRGTRGLSVSPRVLRIALALAVLSVILMASRFYAVTR
jgi:hypothetical protein